MCVNKASIVKVILPENVGAPAKRCIVDCMSLGLNVSKTKCVMIAAKDNAVVKVQARSKIQAIAGIKFALEFLVKPFLPQCSNIVELFGKAILDKRFPRTLRIDLNPR